MADPITHINSKPIVWQDKAGIMHGCEMSEVHTGIRLVWTRCSRDVPANTAMIGRGKEIDCPKCRAALQEAGR